MPLQKGCSRQTARANYKELLAAGKSPDQAYAIMAQIANRSMKRCSLPRQKQIERGDLL